MKNFIKLALLSTSVCAYVCMTALVKRHPLHTVSTLFMSTALACFLGTALMIKNGFGPSKLTNSKVLTVLLLNTIYNAFTTASLLLTKMPFIFHSVLEASQAPISLCLGYLVFGRVPSKQQMAATAISITGIAVCAVHCSSSPDYTPQSGSINVDCTLFDVISSFASSTFGVIPSSEKNCDVSMLSKATLDLITTILLVVAARITRELCQYAEADVVAHQQCSRGGLLLLGSVASAPISALFLLMTPEVRSIGLQETHIFCILVAYGVFFCSYLFTKTVSHEYGLEPYEVALIGNVRIVVKIVLANPDWPWNWPFLLSLTVVLVVVGSFLGDVNLNVHEHQE